MTAMGEEGVGCARKFARHVDYSLLRVGKAGGGRNGGLDCASHLKPRRGLVVGADVALVPEPQLERVGLPSHAEEARHDVARSLLRERCLCVVEGKKTAFKS